LKNIVTITLTQVHTQLEEFKKEDVYKRIVHDFVTFCEDVKNTNKQFVENEMKKLKRFRDYMFDERDIQMDDINSEPVNQEELMKAMTGRYEKFKAIVNSKTDVKHSLMNNKYSNLGKENLVKRALDCLKGDQIVPPKQQFLSVHDLNIKDIKLDELDYAKRVYELNNAFDMYKREADEKIVNQVEKTLKQEQRIYEDLLEKANSGLRRMEDNNKISEELIVYMKNKLNEEFNKDAIKLGIDKLSFYEQNLEQIKAELKEEDIAHVKDRLNVLESDNRKVFRHVETVLGEDKKEKEKDLNDLIEELNMDKDGLNDYEINQLYSKFTGKEKSKKQLTFSAQPNSMNFRPKKVVRPTTQMKNMKKI
jgi:hypothetical protein